jgi:hypothetical protein
LYETLFVRNLKKVLNSLQLLKPFFQVTIAKVRHRYEYINDKRIYLMKRKYNK